MRQRVVFLPWQEASIRGQPWQIKPFWGIALSLGAVLIVLGATGLGAFQRLEAITYDARLQWAREDAKPHPDIAVVLIDETSLEAMNPLVGRFPWPRSVYADLIDFLVEMGGAKAVVFDLLFTEHQKGRVDGLSGSDRRLAAATLEAGNVYHAAQVLSRAPEEETGTISDPDRQDLPLRFTLRAGAGWPTRADRRLLPPFDALFRASRGVGVVALEADPDGVYRRARPIFTTGDRVLPALSLAPLLARERRPRLEKQGNILRVGGRTLPLTADGRVLVNQVGVFEPYSVSGLFAAHQQLRRGEVEEPLVYPDEFAGKIVFIGASAAGLEDIKTTGLSGRTPGVLIHASLASNFLTGDFLSPVPPLLTATLVAALAAATVTLVLGSGRLWLQVLGPLALAAGYAAWTFWRFEVGAVYALTPPVLSIALSWLGGTAMLAFTEGREKRRVRRMFSQYVSPEVLTELTSQPGDVLRAEVGRQEYLTVLFSDIRDFTSISESLSAAQVVEVLNTYLSEMSEVIMGARGTLDKYVGDAVMAFWGAPVRVSNHAELGVRAALAMQGRLAEVNRHLEAKCYPQIRIGIGLHTDAVILGNIGSERRLDYTVIGDSVNLASRLEGMTKVYGCPVLISENTRSELDPGIPCARVDVVRVQGRQGATRVYWPLALPEDDPAELNRARKLAALVEEAFGAYLARHWDKARKLYDRLPADWPFVQLFRNRCRVFLENPPSRDWDGVYTLPKK